MIFGRVKSLDAILATAERKGLHRTLGWFQLMLFGIGCVIGGGIFVLTSVGAQKAGPGLMLAFAIAGVICIVAALCYAEIASMIPVAGSAYTYTYTVLGEILAWTVGWALVLEYAVAASAVAVSWSGYFSGTILKQFFGFELPPYLANGPLALGRRAGRVHQPAGCHHRASDDLAADGGHVGKRQGQRHPGGHQSDGADRVRLPDIAGDRHRQLQPIPARRRVRRPGHGRGRGGRGRDDLLRLCGLRRGLHRGGGDQEPAKERAHRPHRIAADLHHFLHPGRGWRDRGDRRPAGDERGAVRAAGGGVGRARAPVRHAAISRGAGLLQGGRWPMCSA